MDKEVLNHSNFIVFPDINECAEGTHSCQQYCHNHRGGYHCHCFRGYTLARDRHSCQANGRNWSIYLFVWWGNSDFIKLYADSTELQFFHIICYIWFVQSNDQCSFSYFKTKENHWYFHRKIKFVTILVCCNACILYFIKFYTKPFIYSFTLLLLMLTNTTYRFFL